ncbi:prephenate dehydratase [Alloscardovia omnicolens]|uniref:prephenate dehydratase n=1 Tax=Alloscardovia omnicolens TaxID=419015 RepID=UPI003A6BAEA1
MRLFYLGPRGSFTYQAAQAVSRSYALDYELEACVSEREIFDHVERGDGWGIIAWENNVEGYIAQNLDRLIDAHNIAGIERISVNVEFDAFVRPDHTDLTEVSAHPHGLAQCSQFITEHHLRMVPEQSNTAACQNLQAHQIALGPQGSGKLYGLETYRSQVQDYQGAHTDFLVLASRDDTVERNRMHKQLHTVCESIITVIPLVTGPGVVANLLDVFRDNGLNMTSLISRPIKAVDGTYSFVITLDASPWDAQMQAVIEEIQEHGDWVKILAVYPHRDTTHVPASQWNLPHVGHNPMLMEE